MEKEQSKTPVTTQQICRVKKRKTNTLEATILPWEIAKQSKRMLNDKQVSQLYIPGASRGALSMGRHGLGPYRDLPFHKLNRSCLYVECEVVAFVENAAKIGGLA